MLKWGLFLAGVLTCTALPAAEHKNVVVFVADDLGMQLGCYGDAQAKTPNLDRLAREGVRFEQAHCTTASCSASRSVILTGLYNHATGHYGHAHADGHFSTYESVRTLPVLLSEGGYRTCSIGKYHVAPEYVYHFDAYLNEGVSGGRNGVRMAQNAGEWIKEDDSKPFFLYVCSTDPHRAGAASFANEKDYPGHTPVKFEAKSLTPPNWLPDQPEVRREMAEFYEAIARLDQGVGALMTVLEETGHADDTLVLFLSDNGPPFPGAKTNHYEPGSRLPLIVRRPGLKQAGVTTQARVTWADLTPTILDWCEVQPGPGVPLRPSENTGERKTAGKQPYRNHGKSFLKVLDDPGTDAFDEIFLSHTFHEVQMYYPMRTVISGRYKYIYNVAHQLPYPFASDLYASPTWQGVLAREDDQQMYGRRTVQQYVFRAQHELYDLVSDPDEIHNLAGEPEQAERLKGLQEKLQRWQKGTGDPWVTKWVYE